MNYSSFSRRLLLYIGRLLMMVCTYPTLTI